MGQAGAFFGIGGAHCYALPNSAWSGHVKRVNLLEYFDLAEALLTAKRATALDTTKAGHVYFATFQLPAKLRTFVADDNGFNTCKHVARELADAIDIWLSKNAFDPNGEFSPEKFDADFQGWQLNDISRRIDSFKSVFEAECRDVDVYSVGEISLYKTSALVSAGENILPPEIRDAVGDLAKSEFTNAAKCLAFDLPTACGFHALRAMELVMDDYLASFGVVTDGFKSWNDYIKAAEGLIKDADAPRKPSAKVTAMLDRMRSLDRNPLMHPRDTLDQVGADQLFKLSAITVVEMVREMKQSGGPAVVQAMLTAEKAIAAQ